MLSARMPASAIVRSSVIVALLGLGVLAGCAREDEGGGEEVVTEDGLMVQVGLLRSEVEAAHRMWSDGDRAEAAAAVRRAYAQRFEPLEPELRAHDPVATMEIEYGFGLLARQLEGRSNPVQVAEALTAHLDRIDALAAATIAAD